MIERATQPVSPFKNSTLSLAVCFVCCNFPFVTHHNSMKITILTTALTGLGLLLTPLYAEDSSPAKTKPIENSTQKTISTYIVQIKGGG